MTTEAKCSSETAIDFQRITRRYIPEDIALHNHRYENLNTVIAAVGMASLQTFPVFTLVYVCWITRYHSTNF
jgi:hypothetical protein